LVSYLGSLFRVPVLHTGGVLSRDVFSSSSKSLWVNYGLLDLLCPSSLSFMWSFGFVLGVSFLFQLVTGILLTVHFRASSAFESVIFLSRESFFGGLLRSLHGNGVSLFFVALYLHVFRGLAFSSFTLLPVWSSGVVIFILCVLVGFLGYSLPWAQMSFWAASVITNLATAVPVIGGELAQLVWGGYSVGSATLSRFYSLHYLLPFVLLALVVVHLLLLHLVHSHSPLFFKSESVKFNPFFTLKDLLSVVSFFTMLILLAFLFRAFFLEKEMFELANPLMSPEHIVPEWYFLPFYAVLRAVPSKLGGVVLMVFIFVLVLLFMLVNNNSLKSSFRFSSSWLWLLDWCLLFWAGSLPVVFPFDLVGKTISLVFFGSSLF